MQSSSKRGFVEQDERHILSEGYEVLSSGGETSECSEGSCVYEDRERGRNGAQSDGGRSDFPARDIGGAHSKSDGSVSKIRDEPACGSDLLPHASELAGRTISAVAVASSIFGSGRVRVRGVILVSAEWVVVTWRRVRQEH